MNDRGRQRGSVLLVVLLLGTAMAAASAALLDRAAQVAMEMRARRDVLCARYAAAGGLALAAPTPSDGSAAGLVDGTVDSLVVSFARRSPSWCVLRSSAVCGSATRTLEHTADVASCEAAGA